MRRKICLSLILLGLSLAFQSAAVHANIAESTTTPAPKSILKKLLKKLGGTQVEIMETHSFFQEALEITITQPIDHTDPKKGSFTQHIYWSHKGFERPVVFETEGYALRHNKPLELSKMLDANQIQVEFRFFGGSKPMPFDWQYLTNKQAADDLHAVVQTFKKHVYKNNKWISTGVSKGGETTLIFRHFYPTDVDVCVPYVAPIILSQEDPRTDAWQKNVGEEWCRAKISAFQRLCLTKRGALIPQFEAYAAKNELTFPIGADAAMEYAVLEYPFSFWQWGGVDCADIPPLTAHDTILFQHLTGLASPWYYTNKGMDYLYPSFYIHLKELGYYGYPKEHLKDLLVAVPNPTNSDFAPKGVDLTHDADFVPTLLDWLAKNGNNILYIYGELDTWTACAVEPSPETNSKKFLAPGGAHGARIKQLSAEQKAEVYKLLGEWLSVKVKPVGG